MSTSDNQVSLTEIARFADVKPPAVSNWRRRYQQTFPRPNWIDGQELFLATEVTEWLNRRKIRNGDLKNGEMSGMTYGDRFRRNRRTPEAPEEATPWSALPVEPEQDELIWRTLQRLRIHMDASGYADMVLGLLYLRICEPRQWVDMLDSFRHPSPGHAMVELLQRQALGGAWFADPLSRTLRAALTESKSGWLVAEVVSLLNRVELSAISSDEAPANARAARFFSFILHQLARADGKRGSEFFTPDSVVEVMVKLVEPQQGDNIYDPCCGSGEILAGAAKYVERSIGRPPDLKFFGHALSERSWRLARMNLAVHGFTAGFGINPANALRDNLHADRRFDVIISNPPFNMSDWADYRTLHDHRWIYGVPSEKNANFAWLQHVTWMLSDCGRAAVLMPNGASSSENATERAIRAAMVEGNVVECVVSLPPQLFYSTGVPAMLWLLRHPAVKSDTNVLFIDATTAGTMVDRTRRILTADDIERIFGAVRDWRNRSPDEPYDETAGFSRSVPRYKIQEHGHRLNPRMYIVTSRPATDLTQAVETVERLRSELRNLYTRAAEIDSLVDSKLTVIDTWIR